MGVSDLWQVLSPAGENCRTISDVAQIVAVDVSIWIRQSELVQNSRDIGERPHIRNLFWRAIGLLKQKVVPVIVMEGTPPALKDEVLQMRHPEMLIVRRGNSGRSQLSLRSQECGTLLALLGLPVIQASGEAEATCADLNAKGIVDGCITEDGDVFLFGAKTVFRHFSSNQQKEGDLCMYNVDTIKSKLGLDRRKLIAFALLVGCDYVAKGVPGIGWKSACDWLQSLRDDPLSRLAALKSDARLQQLEDWIVTQKSKKLSHCVSCKHAGTHTAHLKTGCVTCGQVMGCMIGSDEPCPCEWHAMSRSCEQSAIELKIRRCAMDEPLFPDLRVIDAFLRPVCASGNPVREDLLNIKKPSFDGLCNFLESKLQWSRGRAEKTLLPIVTNYFLKFTPKEECKNCLKPLKISKSHLIRGVSQLDIIWQRIDNLHLMSDIELATTEDENVFVAVFPEMVDAFKQQFTKKKGGKQAKLGSAAEGSKKINAFFQTVKNNKVAKADAKSRSLKQQTTSASVVSSVKAPGGGFMPSVHAENLSPAASDDSDNDDSEHLGNCNCGNYKSKANDDVAKFLSQTTDSLNDVDTSEWSASKSIQRTGRKFDKHDNSEDESVLPFDALLRTEIKRAPSPKPCKDLSFGNDDSLLMSPDNASTQVVTTAVCVVSDDSVIELSPELSRPLRERITDRVLLQRDNGGAANLLLHSCSDASGQSTLDNLSVSQQTKVVAPLTLAENAQQQQPITSASNRPKGAVTPTKRSSGDRGSVSTKTKVKAKGGVPCSRNIAQFFKTADSEKSVVDSEQETSANDSVILLD